MGPGHRDRTARTPPVTSLRRDSPAASRELAEIEACNRAGVERIGRLSGNAFLAAGVALYAGEGSKTDGKVLSANTNAAMVGFFCMWLRRCFTVDEARLKARIYLHDGLDLAAAHRPWSSVTGIRLGAFQAPYRATPDPSIRRTKHEHGCVYVYDCCSRTHREIMGLVRALLSSGALPG